MLHSDEKRAKLDELVEMLTVGAARISSEGNGIPLDTFKALAAHVLDRLQGYRDSFVRQHDVDYLARQFQSVWTNLQAAHRGDLL